MVKRCVGRAKEVGRITFQIKELEDQLLREGWFELDRSSTEEARPTIRLRVQLVYDRTLLYCKLKELCEEKVKLVDSILGQ